MDKGIPVGPMNLIIYMLCNSWDCGTMLTETANLKWRLLKPRHTGCSKETFLSQELRVQASHYSGLFNPRITKRDGNHHFPRLFQRSIFPRGFFGFASVCLWAGMAHKVMWQHFLKCSLLMNLRTKTGSECLGVGVMIPPSSQLLGKI